EDIYEVRMRLDETSNEDVDSLGLDNIASLLKESGVKSLAICLLHSYIEPSREAAIGSAIRRQVPGLFVSVAGELSPEIREYERMSTTVCNAYVQPHVSSYLSFLMKWWSAAKSDLVIMTSN